MSDWKIGSKIMVEIGEKVKGKIVFYSIGRCYGFVDADMESELFIHCTDFIDRNTNPRVGMIVQGILGKNNKGYNMVEIEVVDDE